jgi:hypothetical protein
MEDAGENPESDVKHRHGGVGKVEQETLNEPNKI